MPFKTYQEESKDRYGREFCGGKSQYADANELKIGALLRIADAAEKMAASYDVLRSDRDFYKQRSDERGDTIRQLRKSIAGLRGYIKRLEKRTKKG